MEEPFFHKIRAFFYSTYLKYDSYTKKKKIFIQVSGAIVLFSFVLSLYASPSRQFPEKHTITIPDGATLSDISVILYDMEIIQSKLLFKLLMLARGDERGILAGDYYFHTPKSLFTVAQMLANGDFGLTPLRVTVFEGMTAKDISELFDERFLRFDEDSFIKKGVQNEGYLFPDTYLFLPTVDENAVLKKLLDTFYEKMTKFETDIETSSRNLEEIIIMASILEREARLLETKQMISDILWRRIEIGMPLQVDAVFPYFLDKNTFELTLEDLTVDSPYNTYRYKGLPPAPISNPGIDSIYAAIYPTRNKYLFYLSDLDGEMHYAVTHESHVQNKNKYLK